MTKDRAVIIGAITACTVIGILMMLDTLDISPPIVWSVDQRRSEEEHINTGLKLGIEAPDFTLVTSEGDSLRLSAMRGRQVVLVFVDPTCGYCAKLQKQLAKSSPTIEESNVLLVVSGGSVAAQKIKNDYKFHFPVVIDSVSKVSSIYRVSLVPAVYLIDTQGKVLKSDSGLPKSWKILKQLS